MFSRVKHESSINAILNFSETTTSHRLHCVSLIRWITLPGKSIVYLLPAPNPRSLYLAKVSFISNTETLNLRANLRLLQIHQS